MSLQTDLDTLRTSNLTGEKQNALARILAWIQTDRDMSPGEVRRSIQLSGELVGNQDVLNYEHPLLPDPVVSCASEAQLKMHLKHRFSR